MSSTELFDQYYFLLGTKFKPKSHLVRFWKWYIYCGCKICV